MTFAFVFPGQGSQSVGMLNSISERPEVRATLQEASEALGEDVAKLIAEGPAEALSLTTNTCLLYTSPSPRDRQKSRMPSSA